MLKKPTTHKTTEKQPHIVRSVKANLDHGDRTGLERDDVSIYTGSAVVKT